MELCVNGENIRLPEDITLLSFLEERGLNPRTLAAELNATLVSREDFASTCLKEGDRLELLHFVGGG